MKKEQKTGNASKLLESIENMFFEIFQLTWLLNENIKVFENIAESFSNVEKLNIKSFDNASIIMEIVNELVKISNKLREETLRAKNITETLENTCRNLSISIAMARNALEEQEKIFKKVVETNENLINQSGAVAEIIKTLNLLAKQINLLSLNASIEAVKAGEKGKGFAVVSQEIRKLSEKTREANSEIEKTIKNIVNTIKESFEITNKSFEEFSKLKESFKAFMGFISQTASGFENVFQVTTTINSISDEVLKVTNKIEESSREIFDTSKNVRELSREVGNTVKTQESKNQEVLKMISSLNKTLFDIQRQASTLRSEQEIIFGVNPFTNPKTIREMYYPIIKWACEKAGYTSRMVIVHSYDALTQALKEEIVDGGWFSPFAYVEAKETLDNIVPIATPIVNGRASYDGYIITSKKSNIKSLKDLKGKRFGFVDPKSASGYLFSKYALLQEGINPDKDFKETLFLGSHDNVIKAVLQGEIDAGATYNEALERAKEQGVDISDVVIINTVKDIPKDAIVLLNRLPHNFIEKFKEALLSFKQAKGIQGFVEARDERYDIIRRVKKTISL
ncbi:MAG: phosphate/phosphite/phosphonate ABC transporter substrate-binding protein [Synergistetes bacterium]|nr:phosphate/phosphite/phosphonate ABC transporter substrate-binding protein [Synergistota bacterium]MDW8192433.1 phosphate/phosphite/phosphonate ABC transporter substrate-binding protein [Synergistota bacterium]